MSELEIKEKKKISAKAVSIAISVFLGLAVTLCVFVVIQVMTRGYVSVFGYSLFRVVTGSMEPEIPVGALLICKKVDISALRLGDIVCFFSQEAGRLDQIITHRIVNITTGLDGALRLETKGDANVVSDVYYVTAQNLIGQVVYYTGNAGKGHAAANVVSFLTSGAGFITCLAMPCLMIAGLMLQESVKSMRADLEAAMKLLNDEPQQQNRIVVRAAKPASTDVFTPEELEEMKAQIRQELMKELGISEQKPQQTGGLTEEEIEEMSRRIRAELREELSQLAEQ